MTAIPQNPYGSYVLSASAGCGKTYQLSRRFLFLVGAGAAPGDILAITFTKKAASEMSQRIVSEAVKLLHDPSAAQAFDEQMHIFYQDFMHRSGQSLPPPRSAKDTGQVLLSSTQQLRVTTIDSTFWEWVRKFPWEASGTQDEGLEVLPTGFELISEIESKDIYEQAFNRLTHQLFVASDLNLPGSLFANQGLYGLKNRFDQLHAFSTYLWLQRRLRGNAPPLNPFAPSELLPAGIAPEDCMDLLAEPMAAIIPLLNANLGERLSRCLAERNWDEFFRSPFIAKTTLSVSGTYLRAKKRELVADAVSQCEQIVAAYVNLDRIKRLNEQGAFLLELYNGYSLLRDELKFAQGLVEFADLAKGCFRLFHDHDGLGARFLIHQTTRHLLLDEFQDTSRLQWSVFAPLARDLLAGEGSHRLDAAPPPTVFIVGDIKQSIYGFREADPAVLGEAADELAPFGMQRLPLNQSYRTAPTIMAFVNQVFENLIPAFPEHATACSADGTPVSPDCGWIATSCLFDEDSDPSAVPAAESEAIYVAETIARCLSEPHLHPVFDKQLGGYRPMQPRDCVILFRSSTRAGLFEAHLRERGIACLREQAEGFFARQEISDIRALVRWLAHPSDITALVQVLASPIGGLSDAAILASLEHAKQHSEGHGQRVMIMLAHLQQTNASMPPLQSWSASCSASLPASVMETVFRTLALPARYQRAFGQGEGDLAAANLVQFLELTYQQQREGCTTMVTLDRALTQLASHAPFGNAPTTSNAVTLMTIHKSKGLEYPLVVLVDAGGKWEKRDRYWVKGSHSEFGDGIYYTGSSEEQPVNHMEFDGVHERIDAQLREESYRLLYVALTRARQYLLITGHKPKRDGGSESFLSQVRDALGHLSRVDAEPDTPIQLDFRCEVMWAPTPSPAPQPEPWLAPSSLPLAEILSVRPHALAAATREKHAPQGRFSDPEQARLHGLLVHSFLEAHVKKQEWQPALLWPSFQPKLYYRERCEAMAEDARSEGEQVIAGQAFRAIMAGSVQVLPELPFCSLENNTHLLRGRIDLVVEKLDTVLVVDYKTSDEAMHPEAYRGQIDAYCRAVKSIFDHRKPVCGCVFFTSHQQLVELVTV